MTDRLLLAMAREGSAMMQSLEGLSLAFCFNVSSAGIAHLAAFPRLKSLNLDGVRRRELSDGIVTLAAKGRLEKVGALLYSLSVAKKYNSSKIDFFHQFFAISPSYVVFCASGQLSTQR